MNSPSPPTRMPTFTLSSRDSEVSLDTTASPPSSPPFSLSSFSSTKALEAASAAEDAEKNPSSFSSSEPTTTTNIFSHRFRYFILILGCLCLTSNCSNMITMNFTMICMFKSATSDDLNFTSLASKIPVETNLNLNLYNIPTYFYTQSEKSMLIWAVAFGSMVATFPFSILYTKFGARYVFFVAGLISGISTLLIPLSAEMGINYILTLRVFQGIAYAADFAAIGVLCSRWASLKQNGVFISILTCFTPISSSITNPVAGALCESRFGWPSVFYSHGAVSLFLFTLWFIFYTDHPSTHRGVSSVELEKIHRNKSEAHINSDSFIPYKQILTNPVIWAVWLNALADIGSTIFLITYTPTYLNNVLHYSVSKTGILGALPAILNIPFKLGSGYFSDKLKGFDERKKLIAFNSIALCIPGVMLIFLGSVPDHLPFIAIILVTLTNGFLGANCGGFYKCGTLVSRQYSAFVISNIQFIKCLTLFLAPGLVAIFVTDDSNKSQWTNIFILLAVFNISANAIFCYFATDKPADFTTITRENLKQEKMLKKKVAAAKNAIFDSSVATVANNNNNNNNIKV